MQLLRLAFWNTIRKPDAIKVIYFVLRDTGCEAAQCNFQGLAFTIKAF